MTSCRAEDIAVIGMAGRFPGADSIDAFWNNVSLSKETVATLSEDALQSAGVDADLINHPNYVRKKGILGNCETFDPDFFNLSIKEASILDPQHRVLIQCAWEAFENAGCSPQSMKERIGVFVGTGISLYLLNNLLRNTEVQQTVDEYQLLLGNDKDFLATRIGYLFNLKGPCVNVQTGCSSSLVAIHYACQSILNGECALALAGGVSITIPEAQGYLYRKEMIGSPDGRCYAFDERAQGTVKSNGAGVVLLKLAEDAIRDNDHIYAMIRGSAINNDGALKVGYTAPSVQQQTAVIKEALQMADVSPEDIGYIETHGTGTLLGDPIEIKALKNAFTSVNCLKDSCALTSLKSSLGHLDVAAGVANFIRACLSVYHAKLPASLNFNALNPSIDLNGSPFYVNTEFKPWSSDQRIAGVSAFGIGGTNVHVVLQQPPSRIKQTISDSQPLLFKFSAQTSESLRGQLQRMGHYVKNHEAISLQDVAYTLQNGRKAMATRYACWISSRDDLIEACAAIAGKEFDKATSDRSLVWMFSGQGSQYPAMVSSLYTSEPVFREALDACCLAMDHVLQFDLKPLLLQNEKHDPSLHARFKQTEVTQPALFAVEYALALWYQSWGVKPNALIGHSIGEYVAAVVAGVFSLSDAAALVVRRGQLMQTLESGVMVAVRASYDEVQAKLPKSLDIALVNSPNLTVVSGATEAMTVFLHDLKTANIQYIPLQTSHAFHSRMLDKILDPFAQLVRATNRRAPSIPLVSNLTGTWLTADEACSVDYWVNQLRYTVLFSQGIQTLQQTLNPVFLEIGPGRVLQGLVYQQAIRDAYVSLPAFNEEITAEKQLQQALVSLWQSGIELTQSISGQVIPLPTYDWMKIRCWVDPDSQKSSVQAAVTIEPLFVQTVEDQLSHLWQSILGTKPHATDNFFQLGGTSLTAIALIDKLPPAIQSAVSVVHLYQCPQFASFVDLIKSLVDKPGTLPVQVQNEAIEEAIFSQQTEL